MARRSGITRPAAATKYDAHHTVLNKTYGALAELRRELSDSKSAVEERAGLLKVFAECSDSQRAWLLLEDYFEKLSLSRKDFNSQDWWPRLMSVTGKARLEETAILFLRANRPLPSELSSHANFDRFAEVEQAEKEEKLVQDLERWLFPPAPAHLDAPRASLRVMAQTTDASALGLKALAVSFHLIRSRTGEKTKTVADILELTARSAHEQELFSPEDWEFIVWLGQNLTGDTAVETILLQGHDLLRWLARWGASNRIEAQWGEGFVQFHGQVAELKPDLNEVEGALHFTHQVSIPSGARHALREASFFDGAPTLALVGREFFLVRNGPPSPVLGAWVERGSIPVTRMTHRSLTHLRKTQSSNGVKWDQLCVVHPAKPQFVFEILEDTVRLRLLARSERNESLWHWSGQEWQTAQPQARNEQKPEILDDPRLEAATLWLRKLDWFTPEQGLWVGDANEIFLNSLAGAWNDRPADADYLGNPAFHRLFLNPRQLRPHLIVKGSGIDWFSVSAEWEIEGLKLTVADLQRLQSATGRFIKLPDAGWLELDAEAVQTAHEALADLGIDGLTPIPQKVGFEQAAHLDGKALERFGDSSLARELRRSLSEFSGVPGVPLPAAVQAGMRPYQKQGFDFLCHLTRHKLGGVLADDMGLGKTLQTLAWLAWLRDLNAAAPRPALVICPASVLHNWRREAGRFVPDMKVLVLESGPARHNFRKQIPQHDLIVTNYALLRRDLEALQKFSFSAVVLDEAQFIKNPEAQITQSVKQLNADHRLALTGTPLENRLLDLWSIVDFIQPSYLGNQAQFIQNYEPKGDDSGNAQRIARRRLSARLRPLMIRRLKKQVASDLPDRIEERRDCELGEEQRKLYLAELRRSREQVMQTVASKGLGRSKIHVLAALTRLRQICCHPTLVGSDSPSGKTETLLELLEPLLADNQKVLVFSQFVQMLKLLEKECAARQIPTHMLTGETKDRQGAVNAFQADPNGAVFLLSLRAAGTGLNLTTASYVVLYDPWWNPAVEAQAIDRSHRIGQTRTVNAYRLIAPGTVEEKIWELQQRKAQAIADVLGEEGFARSLSETDLEYLFSEP